MCASAFSFISGTTITAEPTQGTKFRLYDLELVTYFSDAAFHTDLPSDEIRQDIGVAVQRSAEIETASVTVIAVLTWIMLVLSIVVTYLFRDKYRAARDVIETQAQGVPQFKQKPDL